MKTRDLYELRIVGTSNKNIPKFSTKDGRKENCAEVKALYSMQLMNWENFTLCNKLPLEFY